MDTNRASAYLDGEWLRLLVNLGYSQDWATGTSAGQEQGSELNLTRDDRADIAEFTTLADVFKKMLKRLAELGVMETVGVSSESIELLLSGKYVMQCWLTWEYNDKAALQQEQLDHEMEMQQGKESGKNAFNSNRLSNELVHKLVINALINNENFPVTPISSTWISDVAVEDNTLYIKVPEWEKGPWMPFRFESDQIAGMKGRDMLASGSKGGWVWDNIWAEGTKAFSKGERDLRPGVSGGDSAEFPFMFDDVAEIQGFGTFEERKKALLEPGPGLIGTEKTRRPLYQVDRGTKSFDAEDLSSITPFEESRDPGFTTISEPSVFTKGRVADPSSITGSRKIGPGPKRKRGVKAKGASTTSIVPYNPTIYNEKFKEILNSNSALMRFAKSISTEHNPAGWGMKSGTTYKIKELVYELANYATRQNRVSYGNSIKAGHPYNYGGEDEFICPRDYKKNTGKIVPLGIYHNLDKRGNIELPEYQVIGTHEVLGWDDELGQEIAKNEYDTDKIDLFFNTRNERNWIWEDYLSKGIEPPISGAYTCNVKKYNGKNYQVNIDLKSMSFVPDGNCPLDICKFKTEEVTV